MIVILSIIVSIASITGYNIHLAFTKNTQKLFSQKVKTFEISSLIFGILLQVFVSSLFYMHNQYYMEISRMENYAPISAAHMPTIACLVLVSFIGYLVLRLFDIDKLSPIIVVLSLSAMFLFVIVSLVWIAQVMFHHQNLDSLDYGIVSVCAFPLNFYILTVTTVKRIVFTWNTTVNDNRTLNKLEKILLHSKKLPLFAFLAIVPLLFVIIVILTLFGQSPDSIIKAWTETAEWTFSQHIPPPRIDHDGHYLCTVAANGHKKLVKPIRAGNRLGEKIVVNRQLCIANAFEEIIEEKTPRFHRKLRSLYNKYGYPLSKHITKNYMSDIVYLMMKPLEWSFLLVIYSVDTKPENRINKQYTNLV